jgi:hypothetical protein
METTATNYVNNPSATLSRTERVVLLLKWTYGLVPIAAGADKFLNLLTDWTQYLPQIVTDIIPLTPQAFMSIVGVIEIAAGIIVLIKPKIGSLVVGFWLLLIVINLLFTGQYFDIAVRDIVMAIGAFSLFMLLNDRKE